VARHAGAAHARIDTTIKTRGTSTKLSASRVETPQIIQPGERAGVAVKLLRERDAASPGARPGGPHPVSFRVDDTHPR
jgi:hypothetical protein